MSGQAPFDVPSGAGSMVMLGRQQLQAVLCAIVGFGVLYNNVLRWYPFPAGRSANDLASLEDNLFGIVVNVSLYCMILLLACSDSQSLRVAPTSVPLLLYSTFVLAQVVLRPDPLMELARSFALVVAMLSADRLATLLSADASFFSRFLRWLWLAWVGSVFLGLCIGLLKTDSVNWGAMYGLSSFAQSNRAEFFFFHLLPYPAVGLSLAILTAPNCRRLEGMVALASVVVIMGLASLTLTRSMIFSCLLVLLLFLYQRSRRSVWVLVALALAGVLLVPGAVQDLAIRARVYSPDPDVDLTNARAALFAVDIDTFYASPFVGVGAQEARRRVSESESKAKTEHGYTGHLSSYGVVGVLFFVFVLRSVAISLRMVLGDRRPGGAGGPPWSIAVAAAAIATAGLGTVWLFGSASAFYDWLGFLFLSLPGLVYRRRAHS